MMEEDDDSDFDDYDAMEDPLNMSQQFYQVTEVVDDDDDEMEVAY